MLRLSVLGRLRRLGDPLNAGVIRDFVGHGIAAMQMKATNGAAAAVRLAIIVPMFNEIVGAENCVRTLLDVLPTIRIPTALIVVDDGSTDGTGAKLDELQGVFGGFEVKHQVNRGYGGALIAGAQAALERDYDYVLFMDSDLTNPPEHIERFIEPIVDGADLVKGCRFCRGGDMRAVPWRRRIISITGSLVARMLFRMGVPDCNNGFRAIRARMFVSMPLKERGFAIILEELYWAKRQGMTVVSVPTSLSARTVDQRTTAFAYRPAMLWRYLTHALRAGIVRYRSRGAGRMCS
jgi:dolichol-phosphate mannosyltransferase